jgi:hypothetical protein
VRYRVVPFGVDEWTVQTWVWWFPIWFTETKQVGYETSVVRSFASSEEAEEWVRREVEVTAMIRENRRRSKARRHDIPPREIPS